MTKEDLLEMIEQKNEELHELHKQVEKLENYKKYEEGADETKAIYDSFVHAGFSEDQAFTLLTKLINAAVMVMK